jgi:hypothetical protein
MMNRAAIRHTLEVTTNLAVLALCITVVVVLLRGHQSPQRVQGSTESRLARGDAFPPIENVKFDAAERTLVLALNTHCNFCRESLPFYRKLLSTQGQPDSSTQIAVIFPNSDTEVREFIEQAQLSVRAVAGQDFAKFQISGTPTLILVGRDGKVRGLWAGELPAAGEKEVISAIVGGA